MPPHSQAMVPPMIGRPGGHMGGPQFTNQQIQPPGYPGMAGRPPPRWSMLPPQQRPAYMPANQPNTNQSSALIAQLTQPPSSMNAPGVNQFGQSKTFRHYLLLLDNANIKTYL